MKKITRISPVERIEPIQRVSRVEEIIDEEPAKIIKIQKRGKSFWEMLMEKIRFSEKK